MSFTPRCNLPGLDPEAQRALADVQNDIARECRRLDEKAERPKRRVTELVEEGSVIAKPGEVVRVQPGDEDVTVILPEPASASDGQDIVVSFEGDGTAAGKVQVVPMNGTCLLPGVTTLNAPGSYRFTSTGGGGTVKPRNAAAPVDTSAPNGSVWSGPPAITTDDLPPIDTSELVDDSVTNAILDEMPGNSVKVNATSTTGNPTDLVIGTNTVLGRQSGDVVAAQVATGQIADDAVTNAKLADMAANTIKVNATGSSASPTDFAVSALSVPGRSAGNLTNLTATAGQQYLRTSEDGTLMAFARISLGSLPLLGAHQTYANITASLGVAPTNVPLADFAGDGLDYNTTSARFDIKPSTSVEILSDTVVRAALTGDVAASQNSNSTTIQPNVVSDAKLRQSAGVSVIGRSANSTGNVADITASSNNRVLLRRSDALSFEQIVNGDIAAGTIALDRLAGISPNVVLGNATASTATPAEIAVGTNSVLGRVAGNVVAAAAVNAQLANMTAGTFKGRVVTAGTGAPQDMTGNEAAAGLRYTTVVDVTSSGTVTSYAPTGFGVDTTGIRVSPAGNLVLRGMALAAGQQIAIRVGRGAVFTVTLNHEDGSANANEAFNTPNNVALVLRAGEACIIRNAESRNNVIATGRSTVADADYGDITVSSNGATWTIDNSAVTLAKIANQADDTFLANISGGSGPPSAVALTTLAGAGLTGGADAILAVGAGTGITVNANDVQLSTVTSETFFGNFTGSTAVPTARAGSSVAGAGLTYTAGGTLAVGAGNRMTANANDVAWSGIPLYDTGVFVLDASTLIDYRAASPLDVVVADFTGGVARVTYSLSDGDRGDVTVSSSGATWTIDSGVVTLAKQANLAQSRIIGRSEGAGTGVPEALTPTQVVAIIDGESPQWSASHRFDSYIQFGTSTALPSTGDIRKAGTLLIHTADDLNLTATDNCTVDISNTLTLDGGAGVTLTSANRVLVNSPFEMSSALRKTGIINPSVSGDTNNWNPSGLSGASIIRADNTSGSEADITGLVAQPDGTEITIFNIGNGAEDRFRFRPSNGSSTAANQFLFQTVSIANTAIAIDFNQSITFWYDGTSSRWRLKSHTGSEVSNA